MQSASSSALHSGLTTNKSMSSNSSEGTITNRQILLIGHAVFAFTAVLCCGGSPFMYASCAWFGWSLHLCVKGGLK